MIFNWRTPVDSKAVISALDNDEKVCIPNELKLIIKLYEVPYVRRSLCVYMEQLVRIFAVEIWKSKVYNKLPENLRALISRNANNRVWIEAEET